MGEMNSEIPVERPVRKRRSDGERSRTAILREAAQLATVEGIGGLSIARLADAVGMSKSGLFAHFGSKQELQLATMETANGIFIEQVLGPALKAPTAIGRLRGLAEGYVRYVEAANFPGGCFFASVASEVDTHPGPVRDVAVGFMTGWLELLASTIREAQAEGDIDPSVDPGQLAFEIEASLLLSNALFVIVPESRPTDKARRSIEQRLAAAAPAATSRGLDG
jgi:AcrR family transcriptional regulator